MSKHLERDLEQLKKDILTMGAMVEEAMNRAILAMMDRRPDLAETVITGDSELDEREVAIEEACLKVLALHQPVAYDLRFIVTVMKVNNDLERMGDLAVNIAERAAFLARREPLRAPLKIPHLMEAVQAMVREALDALVNADAVAARRVCDQDNAVDDMNREMYRQLQELMRSDPETIERGIQTLSVSRSLERIADQATNIAEDVIFLVQGEIVRHRLGKMEGR